MSKDIRKLIHATISDAALDFVHHDRKDDEELSTDDIEDAVVDGVVTAEELGAWFAKGVRKHLGLDDD